jgi:hypothetical protein
MRPAPLMPRKKRLSRTPTLIPHKLRRYVDPTGSGFADTPMLSAEHAFHRQRLQGTTPVHTQGELGLSSCEPIVAPAAFRWASIVSSSSPMNGDTSAPSNDRRQDIIPIIP